ncbi:MAG: protein-L-isoaspartate(D-aspartate) O-methyltransferase [Chitinophagaceae bacterium]|nr:MAG: protein-L-isoaspartate(D-aspartate) O-methyltransferase [Chitinophagaceae bacterium]
MRAYTDSYRHKGLRKRLLKELREKGITDETLLEAMNNLPRHYFFDNAFMESAYEDKAFPIGEGQTISQPFTVAYQTQLLQIKPNEKVLEIGTGSGYQACILAEMNARVYTIERQRKLFEHTRELLPKIGYSNIKLFFGDGYAGLPAFSPFKKILVTAAAPEIPQPLLDQLDIGGMMVIPVDENENVQRMLRITKIDTEDFDKEEFDTFRFVPLLKGKQF